ncbi:MAG: dTDP-4-dehydrorhamnose 3,5-epimerase family protein [Bdellovibrionota bacterium]
MESKIYDVIIKELVSHGDDRGFFREIVRHTDDVFKDSKFAQLSHSYMVKNTVKAWHYHHIQYDFWYIPTGLVQVILYDDREESPTYKVSQEFLVGDTHKYPEAKALCIRIPTGVLHSCKVLSDSADLFYITSETYNPQDEGRYPYNDGPFKHDWGQDVIVAKNDTLRTIPSNERKKIKL